MLPYRCSVDYVTYVLQHAVCQPPTPTYVTLFRLVCEAFGVLFGIWNHCLGAHYCDKGLLPMMYMVVVLVGMPNDVQAV